MDGIHDMGGTQGWGTVAIDPDEKVFPTEWEGRAFALGAMSDHLSGTNVDAFRHALERLHPLEYLTDGYYGRWLACLEVLLVDSGVIPAGAVQARAQNILGNPTAEPGAALLNLPQFERGGRGSLRDIDARPAFSEGDRVRAKDMHTSGHTRMPAYVRGRVGTVSALRPAAVLPDSNAHFVGENPQHVYTVAFDSASLWGPEAEPATINIDLFESYLDLFDSHTDFEPATEDYV